MKFIEMGFDPDVIKAIGELGFESPTPIQEKCIPYIYEKQEDLIANAQTGTGKTAAFGLPIIGMLDQNDRSVQALILSPTRELALQIAKDIEAYTKYSSKINVAAVYGGASMDTQVRDIKRGAQIVVGTPGRTMDLIKRRMLKVGNIKWLVLDEADEMLSMGFKDELDSILENTPDSKQTLLFSATMPKGVETIANKYMNEPNKISVGKKNSGADNVEHIYYKVQARDRYAALKRIVDINPGIYGIVFCRTRRETNEVAEHLMQDGYNADALHGDLSQAQREYVMSKFRNKSLQILVATDVAARGLDVNDLSHVINYNLPDDSEVYVHRSGRTGRAGKKGISICLIHSREQHKVKLLQRMVDKKFTQQQVPLGEEVCERQLFHLVDKIGEITVDDEVIEPYMQAIDEKLGNLSREDLIKRIVSVEFNRFLNYYSGARDLNINDKKGRDRDRDRDRGDRGDRGDRRDRGDRGDRRDRGDRNDQSGEGGKQHKRGMDYSRFHLNLGTKNGISPGKIIGLITDNPQFKSLEIGNIELFKKFSFFEIDKQYEQDVIKHFEKLDYDGVEVLIELSKAKATRPSSNKSKGGSYGGDSDNGRKKPFRSNKHRSGSGGSRKRRY